MLFSVDWFNWYRTLYRSWQRGETPKVNTPDYIRDNIHIDLLAACYAGFVARTAPGSGCLHCAPSGHVESQGAFALRMSRELQPRLGLPCAVELGKQTDFSEPMMRINKQVAARLVPAWDETGAWDRYAAYLRPLA